VSDTTTSATATLDGDRLSALFASQPGPLADPWPVWAQVRAAGAVVEHSGLYLITRRPEVRAVLRDNVRYISGSGRRGRAADPRRAAMTPAQKEAFREIQEFQQLTIVATDGDLHQRLRRITNRAFTPRRIAELAQATARYVDRFTDELADGDEADLMQLAYRVPLMIIGDLLGVPEADRDAIKQWSNEWFEHKYAADDRIFRSIEAQRAFRAYVEDMLEEHRRKPAETSLIAELVGAEREEHLSADELTATFVILLFAGHETTTNLIGTGLLELLRNRTQWAVLCADPGVVPAATEELLRYVSPVQWVARSTPEEIELAGVTIPAGAGVLPLIACANRDPDVFADPDRLDLRRPDAGQHIGFGFGHHFCLGAALARLEAQTAFRTLATRYPELELLTDAPEWRGAAQLRSLAALPVRLGPRRAAAA
jgi:cytochrome P450